MTIRAMIIAGALVLNPFSGVAAAMPKGETEIELASLFACDELHQLKTQLDTIAASNGQYQVPVIGCSTKVATVRFDLSELGLVPLSVTPVQVTWLEPYQTADWEFAIASIQLPGGGMWYTFAFGKPVGE